MSVRILDGAERGRTGMYYTALLEVLRKGGLYHCTTLPSFRRIRNAGFLLPNVGQIAPSFTQSPNSYANEFKAVALFDFSSPREDELVKANKDGNWQRIFVRQNDREPMTVALRIDVRSIAGKLIPNSIGRERSRRDRAEGRPGKTFVRFLEVWHPGRVPVSAVTGYVLVYTNDLNVFEVVDDGRVKVSYLAQVRRRYQRMRREEMDSGRWAANVMKPLRGKSGPSGHGGPE